MSKKIVLIFALVVTGITAKAQVIITNQANPTPTNSSVLLEFGNNEAKGIILPTVEDAPGAVGGTFVVNSITKSVQVFENGAWRSLTDDGQAVAHSFNNTGTTDTGDGVIIGADTTDKPGVLVLESTTQALVLPKVANPHTAILSPIAGTIVYDTVSDSLAVYDGANWTYWN